MANLNIEATYQAITGDYLEFPSLCFVDTLDNVEGLRKYKGHQHGLFGSVSEENVERIRRQNLRKISVVIGNPPYNANQLNENENNKNREYPDIDKRIKETYIEASTAQKTKLYDMYARFFRWASDRLAENGVLAFITNRSFIDSRTFDGFRDVVSREFSEAWVVDLGGDVRENPKLSGTKHNVFGIQTGVAISFLVKRPKTPGFRVFYARRPEFETADDKLAFLDNVKLRDLKAAELEPDQKHNWINLTENDFDSLLPLATKATKHATRESHERAIFRIFSLGVSTNRDEWLYDADANALAAKAKFLARAFEAQAKAAGSFDHAIKWSETLKRRAGSSVREPFDAGRITRAAYRPFASNWLYLSNLFIDRLGVVNEVRAEAAGAITRCVVLTDPSAMKPWMVSAVDQIPDLHYVGAAAGAICLPRNAAADDAKSEVDNITDWGLDQFKKHYTPGREKAKKPITKDAIFHYVYGVLHDPVYREKYALNLKREFPRIPFYPDFWAWAAWGEELMDLHIGYEKVTPANLKRTDKVDEKLKDTGTSPKVILKADKEAGRIVLDSETSLSGIPAEAWDYKLGNRCALEWILDQYKEKKPKDPTIREKFNTYRFADYKEKVIDLLLRVTTVSVRTVEITKAMEKASRS